MSPTTSSWTRRERVQSPQLLEKWFRNGGRKPQGTQRRSASLRHGQLSRRSDNGRTTGARWVGQDRAAPKGSLDAPKRSRIIEDRSDGSLFKGSPHSHSEQPAGQADRTGAVQRHDGRFGQSQRDVFQTTWPVAGLPSGRVRGQPGSLIRVRYAVQRMMGACCAERLLVWRAPALRRHTTPWARSDARNSGQNSHRQSGCERPLGQWPDPSSRSMTGSFTPRVPSNSMSRASSGRQKPPPLSTDIHACRWREIFTVQSFGRLSSIDRLARHPRINQRTQTHGEGAEAVC
jgi:hypothetical protein